MAEKKSPLSIAIPSLYPFEDEAIKEKRKAYEEALARVTKSLDQRKSRIIDPKWAAAAEAFLTPKATGSSFESFGLLAKNLSKAQREEEEEEKMISAQNLELARAGLDMSTQAARTKAMLEQYGVAPSTGDAPGFQSPGGAPPDKSPLPGAMNKKQFVRNQVLAGVTDPAKIEQAWAEYSNKMSRVVGGTAYTPEGQLFDTTARVERQIPELGGTFSISLSDSMELDESRGDPARRAAIIDKIAGRPSRPATAPSATPAAPLGAPAPMSKEELAAEAAGKQEFAGTTAKKAAELESTLPDKYQQAMMMSNIANEISTKVLQSPQVFGVLRQPGPASALGRLIQEGVKAGNTSISLGGFEDAIRQANPNIKQADLDNLMMVAGNLAELELIYTNLYLRGGGQITEGEREIVRRVVGSPALSPKFLVVKSEILKARSDQDIALYNAYQKAKENNPRIRYADWLNQNEARGILNQFDKRFKSLMGLVPRGNAASSGAPKAPSPRGEPDGVEVPDSIPKGTKIERRPL